MMDNCQVFLCYRQMDGAPTAEWLHSQLNGHEFIANEERLQIEVYFDKATPGVGDWTEVHKEALMRARAMLVICTAGLRAELGSDDWVHRELEWWLKHRKTAPILIDTINADRRWIPPKIERKWHNVQLIDFDLKKLECGDYEADKVSTQRIVLRIVNGIRHSLERTTHEDLILAKRLSRRLLVALMFAIFCLAFAAFQWFKADSARGRERRRAADLKIVTDFQASMLGDVDIDLMGIRMVEDLLTRYGSSLSGAGISEETLGTRLALFEESLWNADPTAVAFKFLDDNILVPAIENIPNKFANRPLVRASLLEASAETYRKIGHYESAVLLQSGALQTRRQILGDNDTDTLTSINKMGVLLYSTDNLAGAMLLFREALEGRRHMLGDNHLDTITSLNDLGVLLIVQSNFTEAEQCLRKALNHRREILGVKHLDTLESIGNMGTLFHTLKKHQKAEKYYREALEGYRNIVGDGDGRTIIMINNLTALLLEAGKLAEAEGVLREAVPRARLALGNNHPLVLILTISWGKLLHAQGRFDEAESYRLDALVRMRRVLGHTHRSTLTVVSDMGFLRYMQGRYPDAVACFREALGGYRRKLGDCHPDTMLVLGNLIDALTIQDNFTKAEAELLATYERVEAIPSTHGGAKSGIVNLFIKLYDAWHASEPEANYDAKAVEWRSKLLDSDIE